MVKQIKAKSTLQEAAYQDCKKSGFNNTSYASHCMQSFINGAKYQAEKSYSEEEILNLISEFATYTLINADEDNRLSLNKWFEQFKKK